MLNFETIEFIGLLNELAEKTKMAFSRFQKQRLNKKMEFYMMTKIKVIMENIQLLLIIV